MIESITALVLPENFKLLVKTFRRNLSA